MSRVQQICLAIQMVYVPVLKMPLVKNVTIVSLDSFHSLPAIKVEFKIIQWLMVILQPCNLISNFTLECGCNLINSVSQDCDSEGRCSCKHDHNDLKCEDCPSGYFGYPECKGIE